MKGYRYRIRPCSGDKSSWLLCRIRDDGSESDSYGSYTTAHSLDALLERAGHLKPRAGVDQVEFIPPE